MSGGEPTRGERPHGVGLAGRSSHWLGLDPDQRTWSSRRLDYLMLFIGLVMLASNALSAAAGNSPLAWLTAVVGGAFVLLAVSDLLAGGGARLRLATVALRVAALLCLAGVAAGWVWAAATGSRIAAVALAVGAACAALALLLAWARR